MVVSVFLGVYGKTIDLCDTEEQFKSITVLQLKEKIIETIRPESTDVSVAAEALELIFKDKLLDRNSALLSEYGIQHMSVIRLPIYPQGPSVDPGEGDRGMGDKGGKNRSMEKLFFF